MVVIVFFLLLIFVFLDTIDAVCNFAVKTSGRVVVLRAGVVVHQDLEMSKQSRVGMGERSNIVSLLHDAKSLGGTLLIVEILIRVRLDDFFEIRSL